MDMERTIITCCLLAGCITATADTDNDTTECGTISGEFCTEVNHGHRYYGAERTVWDFPHVVVSAALTLGRGWSIEAEIEYERIHEDGEWCNDMRNNFASNRLYISKRWDGGTAAKAGIIDVPLGITNACGPALTIYDPESEALIMPMTWHEAGAALSRERGRWTWTIAALAYSDFTGAGTTVLGGAAKAELRATEGLRIGMGGFYGSTRHGMMRHIADNVYDCGRTSYCTLDADYEAGGITAGGSLIYRGCDGARSFGAEAGYEIGSLLTDGLFEAIPFVRYDNVTHTECTDMNKVSFGLNISPADGLTIKAEYAIRKERGCDTEHRIDFSVGYSFDF